ncbi:MAG: Slp family lipoprotein [Nitrospira sp.]|nr:Slp family lipoprotein [Nitrospira sp.]
MRNTIILAVGASLTFSMGCASQSLFPSNGSEALKSKSEFGVLAAQPDAFQGRAIKLAGRMIGVEDTADGSIVRAEWLPYPNNEFEGPTERRGTNSNHFAFFYPGQLDWEGRLPGNKFLVVGVMEGTKPMVTEVGLSRNVPYLQARCLHVWKTGGMEIDYHQPNVDLGYPVMKETYCSGT